MLWNFPEWMEQYLEYLPVMRSGWPLPPNHSICQKQRIEKCMNCWDETEAEDAGFSIRLFHKVHDQIRLLETLHSHKLLKGK